jgi:hypothetical protein
LDAGNNELQGTESKAIAAYFKVAVRHLPEMTDEIFRSNLSGAKIQKRR